VSVPGTYYPHYYQLYLPVLVLGGAWGIVAATAGLARPQVALVTALAALPVAIRSVADFAFSASEWSEQKYGSIFLEVRETAVALQRLLKPGERFYAWGDDPGLYYYGSQDPPTGITWRYWLVRGGRFASPWNEKALADLRAASIDLFVEQLPTLSASAASPVRQWAAAEFRQLPGPSPFPHFQLYVRPGSDLERRLLAGRPSP